MTIVQDIIRWTNQRPIIAGIIGAGAYLLANPKKKRKRKRRRR